MRKQAESESGVGFDRDEVIARFQMLPPDRYPSTVAYAEELASGEEHQRFDFTLDLLFGGLG